MYKPFSQPPPSSPSRDTLAINATAKRRFLLTVAAAEFD
jgi:hypothetical protein